MPNPRLNDEQAQKINLAYETIAKSAHAILDAPAILARDLGVLEHLTSLPSYHKLQELVDLAVAFYAHRLLTVEIPSTWARMEMEKEEGEAPAPADSASLSFFPEESPDAP